MPKPNGRNRQSNYYDRSHYTSLEHQENREHVHRVRFKPLRGGGVQVNNRKGKDWSSSLRAHFEDEDIDMGATAGHSQGIDFKSRRSQFNRGGGRGVRVNSPVPRGSGGGMKRRFYEGPLPWYKVLLPYGNKYERDFILKVLLEHIAPFQLIPILWRANGNVASFYVDDFKTAEKLNNLDRNISLPDGFKLLIKVSNALPNTQLSTECKDQMKLTMAKRYNSDTKALDLTKFHADPDLLNFFCALFKPVIMLSVLDIIAENIPEIEALNLEGNKIHIMSHLKGMSKKLPNLKVLHLGNNSLRDIRAMDVLTGMPIVDLVLDGNPLCDKYKDRDLYVSEVRKRFPKVMKLDGIDLPPPIGFDLSEEVALPPAQQTFLCSQQAQEIVRKFLEQYFLIFDTDNRQNLLQAYHENAMFSMTAGYPYGQTSKSAPWLNWYMSDNRNLLKLQESDRRYKLLKQGQVSVVSFLTEMPKTKHDIHSFTVDLNLFTPHLLLLIVSGMFKETGTGQKNPPIRAFNRSLVIVPAGSGFCIANEQLFITNATEEQKNLAFKTPIPLPVTPQPLPSTSVAVVVSPVSPTAPDDNTKLQMIQAMSTQSGMNVEYSRQCLEETNWDYQRAGAVFLEFQKQGKIPPEAFVK